MIKVKCQHCGNYYEPPKSWNEFCVSLCEDCLKKTMSGEIGGISDPEQAVETAREAYEKRKGK